MPSQLFVLFAAAIAFVQLGAEARPIYTQSAAELATRTGSFEELSSGAAKLARQSDTYPGDRRRRDYKKDYLVARDLALDAVLAELVSRRSTLPFEFVKRAGERKDGGAAKEKDQVTSTADSTANSMADDPEKSRPTLTRSHRLETKEQSAGVNVAGWLSSTADPDPVMPGAWVD